MTHGESLEAQDSTAVTSFVAVNDAVRTEPKAMDRKGLESDEARDVPGQSDLEEAAQEDMISENALRDNDEDASEFVSASRGTAKAKKLLGKLDPIVGLLVSTFKKSLALVRSYPRAGMASALSIAILLAVLILQPGKGKHDTVAQIRAGQSQTVSPSEPLKVSNNSPPPSSDSHKKTKQSVPRPGKESGDQANVDLPVPVTGPDTAVSKNEPGLSGNSQGLQKNIKAETKPPPDEMENTSVPPLSTELVKLPADESVVTPAPTTVTQAPQVNETQVTQSNKNGPGHEDDLALPPEPAPNLNPVLELAAAEVKPGTLPDPAPTPAPSLMSVLPPALQNQTVKAVPAPVPAPLPVPTPATPATSAPAKPGKVILNDGTRLVADTSKAEYNPGLDAAAAVS